MDFGVIYFMFKTECESFYPSRYKQKAVMLPDVDSFGL